MTGLVEKFFNAMVEIPEEEEVMDDGVSVF